MDRTDEERQVSYEFLKKYGAKWAVLAAMEVDLTRRGVSIPTETLKNIEMSRVKISSGCFSSCEAHCDLNKIEGSLVSVASSLGDEYMENWFDLLGEAMTGNIDAQRISEIPLLKPVESKCFFLGCKCSG
jgi:hypothetical protein